MNAVPAACAAATFSFCWIGVEIDQDERAELGLRRAFAGPSGKSWSSGHGSCSTPQQRNLAWCVVNIGDMLGG